MPLPVYMICCEQSVTDKVSSITTHINVIEKFIAETIASEDLPDPSTKIGIGQSFSIISVWMHEEGDLENDFEIILRIFNPEGSEVQEPNTNTFRFTPDKAMQRITFRLPGFPITQEGVYWISSEIRSKTGNGEWIIQRYPIIVELQTPPDDDTKKERAM